MAASSLGGVWMGLGNGRVVRYHRGVVASSPHRRRTWPPSVNALIEDRRGSVWAATGRGLFRLNGNGWARVAHADGHDSDQSFSVYEDRTGRVWTGTARGVYRYDGSLLQMMDGTATYADSIAEDFAGNVWVTDRASIVRRLGMPPNGLQHRTRHPPAAARLACHTGRPRRPAGGVVQRRAVPRVRIRPRVRPSLAPVEHEDRLRGSPRALYRDRENNVWVGMRGGLLRLSENTFQTAGPLAGLNHDGVRTAEVAADGSVWIATTQAITQISKGSRRAFAIGQPRALRGDRSGDMWVATDHIVGRYTMGRFVSGTRARRAGEPRERDHHHGRHPCGSAPPTAAWSRGMARRSRHIAGPANRPEDARASSRIRLNHVWAGFGGGGVTEYDNGAAHAFGVRDGMSPGSVWQIAQGEGDDVWAVTSGGVSRFRQGRVTAITTAHAPISGVVGVLLLDAFGYVWLGIESGAVPDAVPRRARWTGWPTIPPTASLARLRMDYGRPRAGTQVWQSGTAGVRDQAGRIWVVDGSSMTIIDPRLLREPRRLPPRPTSTP